MRHALFQVFKTILDRVGFLTQAGPAEVLYEAMWRERPEVLAGPGMRKGPTQPALAVMGREARACRRWPGGHLDSRGRQSAEAGDSGMENRLSGYGRRFSLGTQPDSGSRSLVCPHPIVQLALAAQQFAFEDIQLSVAVVLSHRAGTIAVELERLPGNEAGSLPWSRVHVPPGPSFRVFVQVADRDRGSFLKCHRERELADMGRMTMKCRAIFIGAFRIDMSGLCSREPRRPHRKSFPARQGLTSCCCPEEGRISPG